MSAGALFALFFAACDSDSSTSAGNDFIAVLGNHRLTRAEVAARMPGGLTPDDSARFVKAYVNDWIDTRLVSEVAAGELDMSEIDRMVADYRNTLIMQEYRRRMFETHAASIPDDSVKAYYEAHKTEFVLDRPMVKGTYLKVPDDARNLAVLRKLYRSNKAADADKLEKEVLSSAVHYDYFRDRWVNLDQVETRIPIDFSAQVTASLQAGKPLDVHSGGFVYLLSVSEYLPSGSVMPFEAAEPLVRERLLTTHRMAYAARLRNELFSTALDREIVRFPTGFNPLK